MVLLFITLCSFALLVAAGYAGARRSGVGANPDLVALAALALLVVACGPVQGAVGALCLVAGLNEGAWRAVGESRCVALTENRAARRQLRR